MPRKHHPRLKSLGQESRSTRRGRQRRSFVRRGLRFESLENRVVMTCPAVPPAYSPNHLAGVQGKVFTDVNANGVFNSPPDTAQSGVEVTLLDSDGVTVCASQTTGPSGDYKFIGLGAGTYFIEQSPPPGFKPSTVVRQMFVVTPDDADGRPGDTQIDPYGETQVVRDPPDAFPSASSVQNPGIIGGERDMQVVAEIISLNGPQSAVATVGTLTLGTNPNGQGRGVIQWDGVDGSTTLNPTGLGGQNLRAGGAEGISFTFRNEVAGSILTVDIYTDATHFSRFSAPIPQTMVTDPPEPVFLPFDDPSVFVPMGAAGGADFSNVGAIEALLQGAFEADITLTAFVPTVPNIQTINYGNFQPASLGNFVWQDTNGNGLQDPGEPGVSGAIVMLQDAAGNPVLNADGNPVGQVSTGANGLYTFGNLRPGDYRVKFTPPLNFQFTLQNVGNNPAIDSDANPSNGLTGVVNLVSGQNNDTIDAGLYLPAALGNFVWNDLNRNGLQDPGEPGINGVTVNLLNGNGTPTGRTTMTINGGSPTTDGFYTFDGLAPGNYIVQFVPPPNYEFTLQFQGNNPAIDSNANPNPGPMFGWSEVVTLPSGGFNPTIDAGLVQPASLGDFVWHDLNFNGLQDPGEPGLEDVQVNLLDSNGNVIDTELTDADGLYLFEDLIPGTYSIQVVRPANYIFTFQNEGPPGNNDNSKVDRTTGITPLVTLISGDENLSLDAGLFIPATIGDFVWKDLNGNGQPDPGEPGLNGVGVWLEWAGPDGILDTPLDNLIFMTTTASTGNPQANYLFENLPGGKFMVSVHTADLPQGLIQSADPDGVFDSASMVTLPEGAVNLLQDFGYTDPPKTVDSTSEPSTGTNPDGVPQLTIGEIVRYRLVASLPENTDATAFVNYQFRDNLPQGLMFLNDGSAKVAFVSNDGVTSSGANGLPPTDGSGNPLNVAGSQVNLNAINPTYVLPPSAIVSENGNTIFGDGTNPIFRLGTLVNNDEDVNQEFVVIEFNAVLLNLPENEPGDILNNDFGVFINDGEVAHSPPVPVTPVRPEVDDVVKTAIGYADGVVTFRVTFSSTGTATAFDVSVSDTLPSSLTLNLPSINVQTTGGALGVVNTSAGNTVSLVIGTFPVGATATITYTASVNDPGATGFDPITNTVTVCPTSLPGTNGTPNNPTGSTTPGQPGSINGESVECDDDEEELGAVGDLVWNDQDADGIKDPDEMGLPGVPVKLLDSAGNLLDTDLTDADGIYGFGGLPAGKYTVMVDTSGFPHPVVEQTFDPDGVEDSMTMVMLDPGEVDLTLDFGYRAPIDLQLFMEGTDFPANCESVVDPDQPITYTITVTNNGPNPVNGARVVDDFPPEVLDPVWTLEDSNGNIIRSGTGDIDELVDLAVGEFVIFHVESPVMADFDTEIVNTATVSVPPSDVFELTDTDPSNNSVTDISVAGGGYGLIVDPDFLVGGEAQPGQPLVLHVVGASIPKAYVTFVVGTQLGSSPTPDGLNQWSIANPTYVAIGLSCVCGEAFAVFTVPPSLAGQTIYFQAYEFRPEMRLTEIEAIQVDELTPLRAAAPGSNVGLSSLTQSQLDPIVAEAKARWSTIGLTAEQSQLLQQTTVTITNLPDVFLGRNIGTSVEIDTTAAGHGWFIDPSPADNQEFSVVAGPTELKTSTQPVAGRMDLLTVVMHELGNVLGFDDVPAASASNSLMTEFLTPGTRRLPTSAMANDDTAMVSEDTPVSINVLANDPVAVNGTAGLTVQITDSPDHGQVTIVDGFVTYHPAANYSGFDSFKYVVVNASGTTTNPATVLLTVNSVNDYRNRRQPTDVDANGTTNALDALLAINQMNLHGGTLPADPAPGARPANYFDVDGNRLLSARDVLMIVNKLNGVPEEGEGESIAEVEAADSSSFAAAAFDDFAIEPASEQPSSAVSSPAVFVPTTEARREQVASPSPARIDAVLAQLATPSLRPTATAFDDVEAVADLDAILADLFAA